MTKILKVVPWFKLVLLERYGCEFDIQLSQEGLAISWGGHEGEVFFPNLIEEFYYPSDGCLPCATYDIGKLRLATPIDNILPMPGLSEPPKDLLIREEGVTIVNYDILGLTYWMLSRQEEVGARNLDEHGRFPATASHAYKFGYLERPIVDEWFIILGQIILKTWPNITLKKTKFSVKLSHDVDRPSRFGFIGTKTLVKRMIGSAMKGDIVSALYAPLIWKKSKKKLHGRDPYNTFDWIMDISESNGLKSAFYFICGSTDAKYDADYSLEDPAIRLLMRKIADRGHEIGLHPSYDTYQDEKAFSFEADVLKEACKNLNIKQEKFGGRMHYLRWKPETLTLWANSSLIYDSTLSYADRPGFRCGTCFEYPAINPITKEALKVRIRPLIVMECSVISSSYLGLGVGVKARNKILLLKEACERVQGCFTMLWHNSELDKEKKLLYKKVIENAKK